ncbi:hypothetical protein D3C76_1085830 [compost metagenome]
MGQVRRRQAIGLEEGLPGFAPVTLGDGHPRGRRFLRAVQALRAADRHRRRVVDGAQHTGHILQRTMALAALRQRAAGFALEVDQIGVVLHHQNLSQVQIAVDPNHHSALGETRQGGHHAQQFLPAFLQRVQHRHTSVVEAVPQAFHRVERFLDLLADAGRPCRAVCRRAALHAEIGLIVGIRQQLVHLAQALPESAGKQAEFLQGVEFLALGFVAVRELRTQGSFQLVLRPVPGITLIAQVALQKHQRMRLPLRIYASDLTQHWRDVGEATAAEIAAHFRFRVHAGEYPAQQFQQQGAADQG